MSNGQPFLAAHADTLKRMAGKVPDARIAALTGHSERTIRDQRNAMMLPAYQSRPKWTRRDWLLHSAAGLDFQVPG